MTTIEKVLADCAKARGLSSPRGIQKIIAREMGVSRQMIWLWARNDNVPIKRVMKFAAITGASPAVLNKTIRCITGGSVESEGAQK